MSVHDDYGSAAEFYDEVPDYRERPDVAFYIEEAKASGGPILELGCGTGRVLIPIARAGIAITGLDPSPAMLQKCRRRLLLEGRETRERVILIEGDMRTFALDERFALITIPFRPFQHLTTVEDQMKTLANIHHHLRPGGRLILDLFNPSIPYLADDTRLSGWGSEPEFVLPDGRRVLRRFRIAERDLLNQINHVEMIYHVTHPDGSTEQVVHDFPMRWLFRFEAEHLLVRCSFEIEALYAGYDRAPYGSTYPGELIFVARRP